MLGSRFEIADLLQTAALSEQQPLAERVILAVE